MKYSGRRNKFNLTNLSGKQVKTLLIFKQPLKFCGIKELSPISKSEFCRIRFIINIHRVITIRSH